MNERKQRLTAEALLASVTVFWGATFPIVKEAIAEVPVLSFLWVRFAFAALLLALFAGNRLAGLGARGWLRGVGLGTLLFLSFLFQTLGLARTTSANCAFLTGLNVVWVPLLSGPLLGKKPGPGSLVGVALALVGLFLLTWRTPWSVNPGDALVVVCSVFVALHILGLDSLTEGYDGRALAFAQIATMAALAFLGSLFFEPVTFPREFSRGLVEAIVICAVFATVYAFWVQTTFQRRTTPTRAALIYMLEPVFGALFAYLLAGEVLTLMGWIGGALILGGMIAAELWPTPKGGPLPPTPDGRIAD